MDVKKLDGALARERLFFLDNIKAVAIMMVVAIHALAFSPEISDPQVKVILQVISTIAVPLFFLIDGFLFGSSLALRREIPYLVSVKKSAYRLLLPWLLFTIVYVVLRYFFESIGFLTDKHILGRDIEYVIVSAYGSVYAGQMYFLLALFFIRLLSPVIARLFVATNLALAAIVFLGFCALYYSCNDIIYKALYISGGQEPLTHAIWGLQFYILGVLAFRLNSIFDLGRLIVPSAIVFLVACYFDSSIFFQYAYLCCFFIAFKYLNVESNLLGYIGRNTMGIYLLHSPVILKMTSMVTNNKIDMPIVTFILDTSIALVLSIGAVYVLSRIGLAKYLFGEVVVKHANASVNRVNI